MAKETDRLQLAAAEVQGRTSRGAANSPKTHNLKFRAVSGHRSIPLSPIACHGRLLLQKLDAWWASNRDRHVCRDRGRSTAGRKPALLASANSTPAQAYNHRLDRMTSSDCTCKT